MTAQEPSNGRGSSSADNGAVLCCRGIHKRFAARRGREVQALRDVSLETRPGMVTGLLGPDGAGKTTLMRLATGLLLPDEGTVRVRGFDAATEALEVQRRVGYMPQRFGLYEDLSVEENLDLYADLQGVPPPSRAERYARLLEMTRLGRFTHRLAGRLSGGMKQKLGLACTLVRSPELLLLDEPTVGVDPLSRRELWEIVDHMVEEEGVSVLLSTAYLDEAERCGHVVVLHRGEVLSSAAPDALRAEAKNRSFTATPGGKPRHLQGRLWRAPGIVDAALERGHVRFVTAGEIEPDPDLLSGVEAEPAPPRFEDGFMALLERARESNGGAGRAAPDGAGSPRTPFDEDKRPLPAENGDEAVIEVLDLERRFGSFLAVRGVGFEVRRGEIFGLLGPNGAGKSTTFRMLCGLLPPSGGNLHVLGVDLRRAAASARRRVGYVAQEFSQYRQLTVSENLRFFASAYGLRRKRRRERIDWALEHLGLAAVAGDRSGDLPVGYQQRLAMACALMHEPEILFLDEPTSGVDPMARREFWNRIGELADRGVTVIVTTHFLEEAEYCDRLAVMVEGEILAIGTPEEIRARSPGTIEEATIEDAFIALVEAQRREHRERAAGRRNGEGP